MRSVKRLASAKSRSTRSSTARVCAKTSTRCPAPAPCAPTYAFSEYVKYAFSEYVHFDNRKVSRKNVTNQNVPTSVIPTESWISKSAWLRCRARWRKQ